MRNYAAPNATKRRLNLAELLSAPLIAPSTSAAIIGSAWAEAIARAAIEIGWELDHSERFRCVIELWTKKEYLSFTSPDDFVLKIKVSDRCIFVSTAKSASEAFKRFSVALSAGQSNQISFDSLDFKPTNVHGTRGDPTCFVRIPISQFVELQPDRIVIEADIA